MAATPELTITDGTTRIDLLGPTSGWKLADPYWNPQIAQYKGGGTLVNAQLAEGQRLVHKEYGNVIETIPLSMRGLDQAKAMKTMQEALSLLRQAGDYWAEPYEYDRVWIEVKLPCGVCLTGYSTIVKGNIPELTNPFGQPFFSTSEEAVMEGINVIIEREPFWQLTVPGEIMGPIINYTDNPDFELWDIGVVNSQPNSWDDLQTTHITGTNNRNQVAPKFGKSSLKINVSGSTLAGAAKGIQQNLVSVEAGTEYTVIAWVRSEGISNGVGRILINFDSQLELYRDNISHGWTLFTGKITTSNTQAIGTVSINIEILSTSANTVGTIYVDGIMFIKGDFEQEAKDNILPYLSSSHIVNHWEQAGSDLLTVENNINYVDAWNVPGDVDALIRLELTNATTPVDLENVVEKYGTVRIGMKRSRDVEQFTNVLDPVGVIITDATAGSAVVKIMSNTFTEIASDLITGDLDVGNNLGRFRVFARVFDTKSSGDSNLEVRLVYFAGDASVNNKVLDASIAALIEKFVIVDLTTNTSVNFDKKFDVTPPGQIGYSIEMKRSSGGENARFDYLLIMPTDGGFMITTFDPPLRPQDTMVVNSTGQVESTSPENTFVEEFETQGNNFRAYGFATFQGNLYAVGGNNTSGGSAEVKIWRRLNGVWSQVFSSAGAGLINRLQGIAEFDGQLYTSGKRNNVPTFVPIFRTSDGTTWSQITTIDFNTGDMITFDGKLWIAGYKNVGTAGAILQWDGSTITTNFDLATDGFRSFAIYQNTLFVGTTGDEVFKYNVSNDTWALSLAGGGITDIYWLKVFNDKLYTYSNNGTRMFVFDGNAWTDISSDFLESGLPLNQASFTAEVLNDKLYVNEFARGTAIFDGVSWTRLQNNLAIEENRAMATFEGRLYISNINGAIGEFWAFTPQSISGSSPNFKGVSFLAPSRTRVNQRRHRYIFSYDRSNLINDKDDKALIGIGFIPRYLELPAKEN